MRTGGIYKWENTITKAVYVGQTNDFLRRRREEKYLLQKNKFPNKHFQSSWNKHGATAFNFIILESIKDVIFLTSFEQVYLNYYKSLSPGVYNKTGPVNAPSRGVVSSKKDKPGRRLTEQEKINISLRVRGRPVSEEAKKKLSIKAQGRKHSDGTKYKLSLLSKNMWQDEEIRNKLLKSRSSPEWRKKISEMKIKIRYLEAINIATGLVYEFNSLHDAALSGFDKSVILRVISGRGASHKGFFWQEVLGGFE